jgi:hypothetical protein
VRAIVTFFLALIAVIECFAQHGMAGPYIDGVIDETKPRIVRFVEPIYVSHLSPYINAQLVPSDRINILLPGRVFRCDGNQERIPLHQRSLWLVGNPIQCEDITSWERVGENINRSVMFYMVSRCLTFVADLDLDFWCEAAGDISNRSGICRDICSLGNSQRFVSRPCRLFASIGGSFSLIGESMGFICAAVGFVSEPVGCIDRLFGVVGSRTHFAQLTAQNPPLSKTNTASYGSENGYPNSRPSGSTRRPILGGFLFLLGVALAYGAYYTTDFPNPSWGWRGCGLFGWGCALGCVGYGTLLILGA